MPNIEMAMRLSRRRGVGEVVAESLMSAVRRDTTGITTVAGNIGDAKNTFSSWDSCMQKSYCK